MYYFTQAEKNTLETLLHVKAQESIFEKKLWEKVEKKRRILSYMPGIYCICVCNSLAMNAAHQESDIDLFIITKKNRLWTARIFLTAFFALTGQRKTATQHE